MLLENIFCASLMLFCIIGVIDFIFNKFRYNFYVQGAYLASGSLTIITAILWIARAWG